MALDDAEVLAMLGVLGEPITLGAVTTVGIVDRPQAVVGPSGELAELVQGTVIVHVATGSLPGLVPGASINVNGVPRVVRERHALDDGAVTRIVCAKA